MAAPPPLQPAVAAAGVGDEAGARGIGRPGGRPTDQQQAHAPRLAGEERLRRAISLFAPLRLCDFAFDRLGVGVAFAGRECSVSAAWHWGRGEASAERERSSQASCISVFLRVSSGHEASLPIEPRNVSAAALIELRQTLRQKFPDALPVSYRTAQPVATGIARLDGLLPSGGLPRGWPQARKAWRWRGGAAPPAG